MRFLPRPRLPIVVMVALATVLLLGCGDDGTSDSNAAPTSTTVTTVPAETVPAETVPAETVPAETVPAETVPAETVPAETVPAETVPPSSSTTTSAAPVVVEIDETSFVNINDMTAVRGFFVDNLLGDLDATLAVANNPDGGIYPPGSVVQLVPGEAMVKREAGFSPATGDWEFFELVPSAEGTVIQVRGGAEAVNQFGGSCADCHSFAEPQFDFICEQTHGCEPLPIGPEIFAALQAGDPRPRLVES